MRNADIARVFQDVADLLELKGENPFKIRAYQKAARTIDYLPREIETYLEEGGDLKAIPGVGDAIARKITELVTTGHLKYYEELRQEFPEGISELLTVPGVGPKTARRLASELGISSVEELEQAIAGGRVAGLSRMGEKAAGNIAHHLQALRRKDQRTPIGDALPVVDEVLAALGGMPGVRGLTPAGSLRRFRETIGDIDIMGTADDPERVLNAFVRLPQVTEVLAHGSTKASVITSGGLQVDLRLVEHGQFGSLLQYFTGSKQHNINLRERARRQGLKLSEYGIARVDTGDMELCPTEEDFYDRLGLQYIPPELREGGDEIEAAARGEIPTLVREVDIKGDLHVHSEWSDGRSSIEEMARAAREWGYEYIALTDHSSGRGIAHGLTPERLAEQLEEIEALNRRLDGFRVLSGTEVDIRADGSLDFPDELLSRLDVVVAAVHSAMNQDREKMTRRVLRVLENPHVDILAHPSCRLLSTREPVDIDMEAVLKAAAVHGKAVEVNANPARMDLKDTHAFLAREVGLKLVISTDAHDPSHLGFVRYGVGVARRAWCRAGDILNTRPAADVLASLGNGRG
jgi:DNA polymerase (family 10)